MAEIIQTNISYIRPTQNYLDQKTIDFYLKNKQKEQIPVPVVKSICFDGKYDALDGHHNLAVLSHLKKDAILYVIDSPRDLMLYSDFIDVDKKYIDSCNEQIKKRFTEAQFYVPCDNCGNDILTIEDLIKTNEIIFQ